jgi:hypothetical protein
MLAADPEIKPQIGGHQGEGKHLADWFGRCGFGEAKVAAYHRHGGFVFPRYARKNRTPKEGRVPYLV